MTIYFSKYYQQEITSEQLLSLVPKYEAYCKREGLLAVYTESDVRAAIDSNVAQDLINQFITFEKNEL